MGYAKITNNELLAFQEEMEGFSVVGYTTRKPEVLNLSLHELSHQSRISGIIAGTSIINNYYYGTSDEVWTYYTIKPNSSISNIQYASLTFDGREFYGQNPQNIAYSNTNMLYYNLNLSKLVKKAIILDAELDGNIVTGNLAFGDYIEYNGYDYFVVYLMLDLNFFINDSKSGSLINTNMVFANYDEGNDNYFNLGYYNNINSINTAKYISSSQYQNLDTATNYNLTINNSIAKDIEQFQFYPNKHTNPTTATFTDGARLWKNYSTDYNYYINYDYQRYLKSLTFATRRIDEYYTFGNSTTLLYSNQLTFSENEYLNTLNLLDKNIPNYYCLKNQELPSRPTTTFYYDYSVFNQYADGNNGVLCTTINNKIYYTNYIYNALLGNYKEDDATFRYNNFKNSYLALTNKYPPIRANYFEMNPYQTIPSAPADNYYTKEALLSNTLIGTSTPFDEGPILNAIAIKDDYIISADTEINIKEELATILELTPDFGILGASIGVVVAGVLSIAMLFRIFHILK